MKRVIIGDQREGLLATLETFMRHWGYRVLVSSRPELLHPAIREMRPDLLILGSDLLVDHNAPLYASVAEHLAHHDCPLIVLATEPAPAIPFPHEELATPVDIFALFALLQKHLEKIPRRHLRLSVQLPGLLCRGDSTQLAEIVSLSSQGLFIKTALRMREGEILKVVLPLVGMKKELEIASQVLYCIQPGPDNNYLQGFGLGFVDPDPEHLEILQAFIESRFFGEVADRDPELELIADSHLQNRKDRTVLRIVSDPQD